MRATVGIKNSFIFYLIAIFRIPGTVIGVGVHISFKKVMNYVALNNKAATKLVDGDYINSMQTFTIILKDLLETSAKAKSKLPPKKGTDITATLPPTATKLNFKPFPGFRSLSGFFLHTQIAVVTPAFNANCTHWQRQLSAIVTYNMAIGLHQRGTKKDPSMLSKALKFYQMAQSLLMPTMKNETDSSVYHLFMGVLNNMGCLLYELGQMKACCECFEQILKVLQFQAPLAGTFRLNGNIEALLYNQAEFCLNALALGNPFNTASAA